MLFRSKKFISDDLNTSNAITLIYDLLKSEINDQTKLALISNWDKVLSLDLIKKEKEIDKEFIKVKIEERKKAKENKDYDTADKIRKELETLGIILKDTREGTTYELK